ncbi:THAP domain-containing protein 2 [Habropoda laboriosa]|uniref:THAP domain-containing protein 2 n=1 Tax=Habropoda laboriosa TaxID=597456 RepID=A0A0L7RHC2_9HYME|nr:PREDICTED: extracellular matrix-binding protein ebh-like [Habropoda laboriosa]XP_017793776.1 PREDICTED: extracellular matrix-binding protein ebh-like [Habropoda laboriosa]KOC70362.1 THAP domain-containing protein 2 [Habropoda laboriosa]
MPGCAAVGCNNRSEKGYLMKCFPRDPKLRQIWQERVARADWEPSNNSFLCHVHFEPQEWSITQSGRIRLRKDAVPSIFTVTSTRKSPKKRTKIFDNKVVNILQDKHNIEYMENDTEHSSIEYLEDQDLDVQEIEEPPARYIKGNLKDTHKSMEKAERRNIKIDRQGESIEMMAEDNLADISSLVKQCNFEVESNDNKNEVSLSLMINNSEVTQVPSTIVKEEIKLEVMDHNTFEDSYDEIEEKLKQICDGGSTEDENYKKEGKEKLIIKNQKVDEEEEKMDTNSEFINDANKVTLSTNTSLEFSTKSEIGHVLTDKQENVEIIFGTESGDEKTSVPHVTSKVNKTDNNALVYDEIMCIKDEKKVFNEDIEENFTKDEVHVIPNIRAAMKRKRRTREEIMKSIKKSIKSTSDQDINSSSNSDLSEQETEIRKGLSLFSHETNDKKNDIEMETAKFVIKVTGDPDDVTEIIEELSSNTIGTQEPNKCNTLSKNEESGTFVTSIITVLSPKNPKEIVYRDINSPLLKDDYIISSKKVPLVNHSSCEEREFTSLNLINSSKICHSTCFKHTCSDEEKHQVRINSPLENCAHGVQTSLENNTKFIPSDYEDLLERIQIQEDVIAKLTDQLITYKELENSKKNKTTEHEIRTREMETPRMNTRSSSMQPSILRRKNLDCKQRLIEDLTDRVNYFEEMNKKLMKTVTLESQQKRKLEGQIKQKDNRIKELNWKLEKASKYLERAEKNTNTYRRKMINMQTVMRRRKLLDEKMSKFNEMLIDSSKQEFSEKVLVMAANIRKICGRNGYDKLLSYGFPLPPLPALRKGILNEDIDHKSDADELQNSTKISVKAEKAHDTNNEFEIDEKDTELPDSVGKATEYEGAETVTGTVQDIFDENNDGDDFSTNELREHFILQLNAVM